MKLWVKQLEYVAGLEKVELAELEKVELAEGGGGSLVCWRKTDSRDVSSGFVPLLDG